MTDVGRLADLLDRAADTMLHVDLPRVTPLAVPVLTLIGREKVATGHCRRRAADRSGRPGGGSDGARSDKGPERAYLVCIRGR